MVMSICFDTHLQSMYSGERVKWPCPKGAESLAEMTGKHTTPWQKTVGWQLCTRAVGTHKRGTWPYAEKKRVWAELKAQLQWAQKAERGDLWSEAAWTSLTANILTWFNKCPWCLWRLKGVLSLDDPSQLWLSLFILMMSSWELDSMETRSWSLSISSPSEETRYSSAAFFF